MSYHRFTPNDRQYSLAWAVARARRALAHVERNTKAARGALDAARGRWRFHRGDAPARVLVDAESVAWRREAGIEGFNNRHERRRAHRMKWK